MGGQSARGLLRNSSADTVVVDLFGRTGNTGAARRGAASSYADFMVGDIGE